MSSAFRAFTTETQHCGVCLGICSVINVRDEQYLKKFGKHLKSIRENQRISQEKLAIMADISENQIYNLENGKNNCTICTLKAIAEALNIEPKELLDF